MHHTAAAWLCITGKKKQQGQSSSKADLTIGELKARVDAFPPMDTQWRALPCHQLIVVQGAIVEAERVCIVVTCPGMLDRARAAESKFIKLVVDGKQKIVTNDYTMSFLVPSEAAVQTRGAAKRSSRVKAYTCTQEPFTQAFVSSESLKLETARNISAEHCGLWTWSTKSCKCTKTMPMRPAQKLPGKKCFDLRAGATITRTWGGRLIVTCRSILALAKRSPILSRRGIYEVARGRHLPQRFC